MIIYFTGSRLHRFINDGTNAASPLGTRMRALGRFFYGNWYGAFVAFVIVSVTLCGLQFANCLMGDLVPWPKGCHLALMSLAAMNVGIAMFVSVIRREWWRTVRQLVLVAVAAVCFLYIGFISYCIPTRMTLPPSREWMMSAICQPTSMPFDSLTFLGGISQRETVAVFSVANVPIDAARFFPGSPWTDMVGGGAVNHYRSILEFCRIDAALPDDVALSHCNGNGSNITLIATDETHYLVYERL